MRPAFGWVNIVVAVVIVAGFAVVAPGHSRVRRIVVREHLQLPARDAGLRFAAGTNPIDQQAILAVVAGARPEARRLIDLVDGAVTIVIGSTGRVDAAGEAAIGGGTATVTLDPGDISRHFGARGVARLTLHELGHVVDAWLVPDDVRAQLDAAVPPSYPCQPGDGQWANACEGRDAREERFAESFAKWAMGDIGMGLDFGYSVPPPVDLLHWGDPLASITGPRP